MKKIPFTKNGYQTILDEKAKLLRERPEVVSNLQKAREMGDLSENGYYKESKARLGFLDGRIRHLERLIRYGEIITVTGNKTIEIGNQIVIENNKTQFEYSIVGGYESDPQKKLISHLSPLGQALMGKKINDIVRVETPNGLVEYKILKISV